MNIDKVLKREGIELVSTINKAKIDSISSKISKKICKTFPEHNLNQKHLYAELSKVNMYFADFDNNTVGAKYYYKNKSMYFNRKYELKKLSDLSIHECIHFIQEKQNANGSLNRFGLYCVNKIKPTGLAINEAAVQLMTVKVNKTQPDYVKYYGLSLYTPSPDYYPIECALLNQIAYFIGTFPIFHSTLYSDDVFKTTFITKTNKKTYNYIESSFDILSEYEDNLSKLLYTLSKNSDKAVGEELNRKIEKYKKLISTITLNIQETILKSCFETEIDKAKDINELVNVKNKLLELKKYLILTNDYNFYDLFCCDILGKIDQKKDFIENYGIKSYYDSQTQYLPILANEKYGLSYFRKIYLKTKKLFSSAKSDNTYTEQQ